MTDEQRLEVWRQKLADAREAEAMREQAVSNAVAGCAVCAGDLELGESQRSCENCL